jgi:nucleoside-diphosphate-sugar epimerase
MKSILLTGATGFIGRSLLRRLLENDSYVPIAAVRSNDIELPPGTQKVTVADITPLTDWSGVLSGVDVVIHAAGLAHILKQGSDNSLQEFRRINVDGSLNLASQAAKAGVRRFVFISSIGVAGNESVQPFTEQDDPHPETPYAISKLEAEQGLCEIARQTGLEVVTIRPPLVYGPNAPGNFGRLARLTSKGLPLPLAAIENLRSFVSVDNLVDLIACCISHPAAANQIFNVSDGEDLSTPELLRLIGSMSGTPARLISFPVSLLKLAAALIGKRTECQSLCGSLQIDISCAKTLLEWEPPTSVEEAMRRAFQNAGGLK